MNRNDKGEGEPPFYSLPVFSELNGRPRIFYIGWYIRMDFKPGDVQLLNNATILHAREAYRDDDDPAHRRHLLRLWLAAHASSSVEAVLQGGIPQTR